MTDLERALELEASLRGEPQQGRRWDLLTAALAAARREGAEAEREKVVAFMLTRGVTTGHGDTTEDLLLELGDAWDLRPQEGAEEMRERAAQEALKHEAPTTARAILDLPLMPEEPQA